MTKVHELAGLGQAIWLDYIRRAFIDSGELPALIDKGVRGVTSNPTIFEKAIAGSTDYEEDLHRRLGINPFDQPNVEAAKVRALEMVTAYIETGGLPADELAPLTAETLREFLAQAQPGDPSTGSGRSYIALQAYVQPTAETSAALRELRTRLRDHTRLATTVGYGPRFLHSTGQLHKGDAGNGLFIQFTADDPRDVPIPDEAGSPKSSITFGVLKMAQALGDKQALLDAGRRVIRFHLGSDVVGGLESLTKVLL